MSDEFIDKLSNDLEVVKPPNSPMATSLIWLATSVVYVLLATAVLGPFRPGFADQFIHAPRFTLEMLLGIGAVGCFAIASFRDAVPGLAVRYWKRAGWILMIGWLSQFVIGFEFPALEPSMLGKRDHCAYEAYIYSLPPVVFAIWLQQRRYPLRPLKAALYAAFASGMIPALAMQIACMYEPSHILKFHALPILVLSVGVGLAFFVHRLIKSKTGSVGS